MKIQSIKTLTMKDQPESAIHLYHLLHMQSLHHNHQQSLPHRFWRHQGNYQYQSLLEALLNDDPTSQSILKRSDLILIVYASHEYNPRSHLAGIIQQSTQNNALVVDIIDCGPIALGLALGMATHHVDKHQNIAFLVFEQKTQKPTQATRHDTTQNHVSLLSNIDRPSFPINLVINHVFYNHYTQSLKTFIALDINKHPICISNRLTIHHQLKQHHRHHIFIHGYATLMREINRLCDVTSKTLLWIHLMGHSEHDTCCLWIEIHPKRIIQ